MHIFKTALKHISYKLYTCKNIKWTTQTNRNQFILQSRVHVYTINVNKIKFEYLRTFFLLSYLEHQSDGMMLEDVTYSHVDKSHQTIVSREKVLLISSLRKKTVLRLKKIIKNVFFLNINIPRFTLV